jgi:hypothetical protein
MSKIITQCPSCQSNKLNVVKIECNSCHTKFEGNFDIPKLLQLSNDDINFILNFVKCSGSLKDMSKIHNVSYPTFRNRLNQVIDRLNYLQINQQNNLDNNKILSRLEAGEITAVEAMALLESINYAK